MAKKLIIANWKMNPDTLLQARAIAAASRDGLKNAKNAALVVCPPALFLGDLVREFKKKGAAKSKMAFGLQNIFWEKNGAFTGELSVSMARSAGAEYVILGHSERRAEGETDALIHKKVASALKGGLSVVLCVGETIRDEHGSYLEVIENQLKNTIPQLPRAKLDNLVVAYEPLWAIGATAKTSANPEEVFSTTIFIRKVLTSIVGKELALKMPIVYGGSVDAENCVSMMTEGGVQGLLVGRVSLNAKAFAEILKIAGSLK